MKYEVRFDIIPTTFGVVYRTIEANNTKEALKIANDLISDDSEEFDDDVTDYLSDMDMEVTVCEIGEKE